MAAQRYDNFINGEWVPGASYAPNVNPSDTSDVLGDYAQADAAQVDAAVSAARAAFPKWSVSGIQARADALDRIGTEILARRDELGPPAGPRGRQGPARGDRRSGACRQHLQVLRRRMPAPGRRDPAPRCGRTSASRSPANRSASSA